MFRLFVSAAVVLTVATSAQWAAAQKATQDKARSGPAVSSQTRKEITVTSAQRSTLTDEAEWSPVPDYLRGATMFRPAGNAIDLTANEEVQVLLAVSWSYDGDISGGWYEGRTTLAQLVAQGWQPVGTIKNKERGVHTLLRRMLTKGDKFKFHTRKFTPPVAILTAADKSAAVTKLPTLVIPTNDLSEIGPPKPAPAPAAGKAVLLRTHVPDRQDHFAVRGLLLRELVRQAVLLSAREELGLATRDETLRERWGEGGTGGPLPLDIVVHVQIGGPVRVTLFRFAKGKPELFWDKEFPLKEDDFVLELTRETERLSRDEFPAALRKAGFSGKANEKQDDLPVSASIEQSLANLHWLPQLDAARQLHQIIRNEGESPQRLAALARAYAQLGLLTEHFWSPGHKAFKARALLYAQRAMIRWPNSAEARQGRALVYALGGLHQAALDDLAAVDAGAPTPSWKDAVEAFCRFDEAAMEKQCQEESASLPRMLRLTALGRFDVSPIVRAARSVLDIVPDSDRAIDCIFQTGDLGTRRLAVSEGPMRTADRLYERVKAVTGLPETAGRVARAELESRGAGVDPEAEVRNRVQLMRALRLAGEIGQDNGEPSWQTFAALIEEVSFLQTENQLEFLANGLGVPLDSARPAMEPLVEDHPYREFIASMCDDPDSRKRHLAAQLTTLRPQDLLLTDYYMLSYLPGWGFATQYETLGAYAMAQEDNTYGDLITYMLYGRGLNGKEKAAHLRRVSPHSPRTIAITVEHDWEHAEAKVAEWEKQFENLAEVQRAIGRQYFERDKLAEATRCFERALKVKPDYESHELLANAWLKQNDEKKWLAVWEQYLKQEDFGLTHASVRVAIAKHYMSKRRWEEARPYAEEAAETWAEWAMESAADCLTGLKRYDDAEVYWQRIAQRYVPSSPKWYFWCRKSGHGNLDQARAFVRQAIADPTAGVAPAHRAAFLVLEGEKEAAMKAFDQLLIEERIPDYFWLAAILADELKQYEKRDTYIQLVIETGSQPNSDRKFLVELSKLAQEGLSDPSRMPRVAARAEALVKKIEPEREHATAAWQAGKFLDLHDQPAGVNLLKEAAKIPTNTILSTMATVDLKARKIPLDDAQP